METKRTGEEATLEDDMLVDRTMEIVRQELISSGGMYGAATVDRLDTMLDSVLNP